MTPAPVGLRCPDHAGTARRGVQVGNRRLETPRTPLQATTTPITKILIGINIAVYLITVVQGAGLNDPGGSVFAKFALFGPRYFLDGTLYGGVSHGEWWRLITASFLHASILHLAFNMLALLWFGGPVEEYLGRFRFILLYLVSGLAGSAGALLQNPRGITVGASGAIFGVLGAMAVLEWQATGRVGGNALTLIVINLGLSFAIPNVSWGGHVGGLIGGVVCTLAFARFGRGHAAYGRVGLLGYATLALVAVASVAVSYLSVRGYA
jgi:membrane associated rhomboid family serine protease